MEKELLEFLIDAKKNTYALGNAKKIDSTRLGSNDYEYSKDNMTYHDTYFGGTKFMGEEVVYKDNEILWGMNYYGVTINPDLSEDAMDNALRPALMLVGSDDTLPVRGPKEYINNEYKYTFDVVGDITYFEGTETVYKNDEKVYQLKCNGGLIK